MLPNQAAASSWCSSVKPLSARSVPAHSRSVPSIQADESLLQSSLVLRFVNNDFQENKEPTIGGTSLAAPNIAETAC